MTSVPSSSGNIRDDPVIGSREAATRQELLRREPTLADLFDFGLGLVRGRETLSSGYLLAHAGRELSRGLLSNLTGGPVQIGHGEDIAKKERNRKSIASALELSPQHGLVTEWFQIVSLFSDSCHYRLEGIDTTAVKAGFLRFSDVIYGLLAPYFDTQDELERLAAIEQPTSDDVQLAVGHLERPQQRRFFFDRVQSPLWLGPLSERGLFDAPPSRIIHADGSWQMRLWPEGKYLARIADQAPHLVTALLCRVARTHDNPSVWMTIVDAAMLLPPKEAGAVGRHIVAALPHVPPVGLPQHAIQLVMRLAESGRQKAAFNLAGALLTIQQDNGSVSEASKSGRWRAGDLLRYLDDYGLQVLLRDAIPALCRLNPNLTLRILLQKLNGAVVVSHRENSAAGASRHWCRSFEEEPHSTDVRQMLAAAIAIRGGAIARESDEGASAVWTLLTKYEGEVFQRLRLRVLAEAGRRLQGALDEVVGSELLLDPPYGAREAAQLLRVRFVEASAHSRRMFAYALARGPTTSEVNARAAWRARLESDESRQADSGEPPALHVKASIEAWQATRLRWFHSNIPDELQELALRIGVKPEAPTIERQSLDEEGFYVGGSHWVGRQSPKSVDDLARLTTEEQLSFLSTWEPTHDKH